MKRRRLVVLALVAGSLTACGNSSGSATGTTAASSTTVASTTTTAPPPLSTAQQASAFLVLIAPYNVAITAFKNGSTPNISTDAQLQAFVAPVVAAAQTLDNALPRAGFTGQAATDARKMVSDDGAVIADLQGWTIANLSQGETTLAHDAGIVNGDDNVLRADLGLPPATS